MKQYVQKMSGHDIKPGIGIKQFKRMTKS